MATSNTNWSDGTNFTELACCFLVFAITVYAGVQHSHGFLLLEYLSNDVLLMYWRSIVLYWCKIPWKTLQNFVWTFDNGHLQSSARRFNQFLCKDSVDSNAADGQPCLLIVGLWLGEVVIWPPFALHLTNNTSDEQMWIPSQLGIRIRVDPETWCSIHLDETFDPARK